MKKFVLISSLFAAIAAVSGIFVSCSNDEEQGSTNETPDAIIAVESEATPQVVDFFSKALNVGNDGNGFFTEMKNKVIAINSEESFRQAYLGDSSLPAIDFSRYTLIIGQVVMECHDWMVAKQEIERKSRNYQLNLYLELSGNDFHAAAFQSVYYWGLYKKFNTSGLSTHIVRLK